MRTTGLVVEYNPFHNGHLYHIQQARKVCNSDCIVCVMSGNFIQRGEPAIINKWARAKAALLNGADLVIELPVVYAMASAEYFSYGAVKILDSLGLVDSICFGSESGSVGELDIIAEVLANEPEKYQQLLKAELAKGLSYPAARQAALGAFLEPEYDSEKYNPQTISSANNILGIEYLKALKRIKSDITPFTIKREGNSYNSELLTETFSSATSIRKTISEKGLASFEQTLKSVMPQSSLNILIDEINNGRGPVFQSNFETIIINEIRRMTVEQLYQYPYLGEGLENRLKSCADSCGTLEELIDCTSTKRYTRTRISRCLFSILNGIYNSDIETFVRDKGPQYIRILGFNSTGRELLKEIKQSAQLPLVTKAADYKNSENSYIRRLLELEARSTDIYVLGYSSSEQRSAGQEFTQNVVIV